MNVRTLCLSVLYDGDATGYDIRRLCADGEFSYFVEASYGSIYPALAKLEADRLVTSRAEQQDGRPARKVYSITEMGRLAFAEELSGAMGEDVFRSPFLLLARFAHILPADLMEQRANEFLERTERGHKKLVEAAESGNCGPADIWTINYGKAVLEVAEQYLRTHMHELVALAKAEQRKDAAE
jgi:PadR family transcriptional regulator AphA